MEHSIALFYEYTILSFIVSFLLIWVNWMYVSFAWLEKWRLVYANCFTPNQKRSEKLLTPCMGHSFSDPEIGWSVIGSYWLHTFINAYGATCLQIHNTYSKIRQGCGRGWKQRSEQKSWQKIVFVCWVGNLRNVENLMDIWW